MFPFIYRLWFRAYTYCLKIRQDKGVKSLEHFLSMDRFIFSPLQQPFCCVPWVASTTKGHYMPLNSCSADAFPQWFPIQYKKKTKKTQIPLTGFTQTHTRKLPAFCVTTLWEQMETGAAFSEQVNIKQAQSESRPVQTKSWTSEPRGSKLKVWLLVEMGLLEVTSGKCLRLTHFTAYSHLTSDFLTGSEALDYSVYHFSCNTETVWELNQNICKVCSGLNEALWETGIFLIWGFRCPCLDLSENCTGLVRSETTE